MLKDRGCWWQNRPKPLPASQSCRQHISSPASVANIDVADSFDAHTLTMQNERDHVNRTMSNGSCHMIHVEWTKWNGSFKMDHAKWTISNASYNLRTFEWPKDTNLTILWYKVKICHFIIITSVATIICVHHFWCILCTRDQTWTKHTTYLWLHNWWKFQKLETFLV